MSRVFARLYLDEDVSVLLAALLRNRQFDALTTRDSANLGDSDERQLFFAASRGLVLITHNRADFERLAASRPHAGIVIAVRRPPAEILTRLLVLLDRFTADEFENQVFYV